MKPRTRKAPPKVGLRERKKTKMRVAIQQQALRLFRERGYRNTTIDQIAEAAEISPATFFHYFPTKEAVVVYDVLDLVFLDALKDQPAEVRPIKAIKEAISSVLGQIPADRLEELREREKLIRTVPELRARMLDDVAQSIQSVIQIVANRADLPADDLTVRIFVGAVMGALISVWFTGTEPWKTDLLKQVDVVLAQLETCLSLLNPGL